MRTIQSSLFLTLSAAGLVACSSSSAGTLTVDSGTAETSSPRADSATADTAAPVDSGPASDTSLPDATVDAGMDAGPAVPTQIATFNQGMGMLPEGLWEIAPSASEFIGTTGTPITAWVPLAAPVTVSPGGGASSFGTIGSGAPVSTYTLGVTSDANGNVYYAVAAMPGSSPPNDPAPGIYKIPAAGGVSTVFTVGSAVTPPMNFANGLDFNGTNLYVADSEGVIYEVTAAGIATVWSHDALLAPSVTACGGMVPIPIGANGITHDATNFYVTNTTQGRVIKIPINADGSAGTAVVVREDCASLVGADGILIDPLDTTFIIALNIQNKLIRMSMDGSTVTVLASGPPLASPASPIIDTVGGRRRLLVTNTTFFTPADAGLSAGLVQLLLP